MQMTENEIVEKYKRAEKKRDQIKILSELNACSREDIREILRRHGCEVPGTGNRYTAKNKETIQDELREEMQKPKATIKPRVMKALVPEEQKKIPACVIKAAERRLYELDELASAITEELEKLEKELEANRKEQTELADFLNTTEVEA